MRALDLVQGSPEWHAHRATGRNASDAPAMMGASPYVTRSDLIRRRATGITPEVDAATAARFAKGHEVEPALRAYAEKTLGKDLYPVVATSDDGYLSASFDGVTMDESTIFEAKQRNSKKLEQMRYRGEIPHEDWWQVVQQFAVCNTAERCIYVCGDDQEANHLIVERADVESSILKLRAAWAQFDADVSAYVPEQIKVEVMGRAPESLPNLSIEVSGRVVASNLNAWREGALSIIRGINRELTSDTDFANAEKTVKWLSESEDKLKAAKASAQAQMTDVDALFRTVDDVTAEMRTTRLELDKLVKAEKENRKADIVSKAAFEIVEHHTKLNATLAVGLVLGADPKLGIAAAIKGLKSIKSIEDAAAQVVANAKVAASTEAERHRANLAVLEKAGRAELFADRDALVRGKQTEDLCNLVAARIVDADIREQQRLEAERERIRKEEEAKAKAKLEAEQKAEQERLKKEEEAKAKLAVEPIPPDEKAADPIPPAAPVVTPAAVAANTGTAPRAAVSAVTKTMKLGDINARIAPISLTAEGLATLGFQPISTDRSAKLYAETQFSDICRAIGRVLRSAIELHEPKAAA